MRIIADFHGCLETRDGFCRNHVQHVEVDIRPAAEHVFENRLRVRQRADDNRNVRLLRNFKRAVAEGEQILLGAVRAALGEDDDRAFVLFQELNGLENGLERLTVVFAVDRQSIKPVHCLCYKWHILINIL